MRSIDMNKTLLVTGAAGFIGSHVTQALLVRGDTVVGLDNQRQRRKVYSID
jgi:nucleoside-diphosphate-sugar epimerase